MSVEEAVFETIREEHRRETRFKVASGIEAEVRIDRCVGWICVWTRLSDGAT